jgi:hypothetical protein
VAYRITGAECLKVQIYTRNVGLHHPVACRLSRFWSVETVLRATQLVKNHLKSLKIVLLYALAKTAASLQELNFKYLMMAILGQNI